MKTDPQEIALEVMKGYVNRAYKIGTEAHYASVIFDKENDLIEEFNIGFYHPFDEGTYGEFVVEWIDLQRTVAMRIKMFDDFWHLLPLFRDFMELLAEVATPSDKNSIDPKDFAARLDALGFVDDTSRTAKRKACEPDYARMPIKAHQPMRVSAAFTHLFDPRYPFVVPFFGGADFEDGVLRKNPQIEEWIQQNCQHGYQAFMSDVLFEREEDAMLCQLKFS